MNKNQTKLSQSRIGDGGQLRLVACDWMKHDKIGKLSNQDFGGVGLCHQML